MIPMFFSSPLVSLATQASAARAAVRIIIQVDPPSGGGSPIDPAPIEKVMKALSDSEAFLPLAEGGDGWVLGIQIKTQSQTHGMFAGGATLRLAQVEKGNILKASVHENGLVAEGLSPEALGEALADGIEDRAKILLDEAKVLPSASVDRVSSPVTIQVTQDGGPEAVKPQDGGQEAVKLKPSDRKFPRVLSHPPQPPYPPEAKSRRIQGIVTVKLAIDADGKPLSAVALQGPPLLLEYALSWAMKWRFIPSGQSAGKPEPFILHLNFGLDPTVRIR